jgi:hypothetical protein
VTNRSPLFTLAGLVIAFAVFFGINLANSAPRQAVEQGYLSASPAATTATQPSPVASPTTEDASPSTSPTESATQETEDAQFPDKVVYAGRTTDGSAAIAVAVFGDRAAAYLCDGRNVESWLRGTAENGELKLQAKNGDKLEAKLAGSKINGEIEIKDEKLDFTIGEAKPPAGLYRAKGSKTTIGWIVLPDGNQVGIQTNDQGESQAAPELDPNQPEVNADGEDVTAMPVKGNEEI